MSSSAEGALLGLALALGIAMFVSRVLALRPPSMLERIAPFVPSNARLRSRVRRKPGVIQVLLALIGPMLEVRAASSSLEGRLAQANVSGLERFRLEQAAAVGVGAGAGALLGLMCASRGGSPLSLVLLLVAGASGGAIWADRQLKYRARARQEQIARELPAVAELLAFAAAAGESPSAAVERVSRTLGGELGAQFQRAVADVRGGQALDVALRDLVARLGSPPVERFVDALVIAIDRGSPLAEVLRAQASDVRADARRSLLEKAGRREVAMLIPVVFLILPTVVLIAVYPGIQGLQLTVHS